MSAAKQVPEPVNILSAPVLSIRPVVVILIHELLLIGAVSVADALSLVNQVSTQPLALERERDGLHLPP